jgi:long-subunit fatty acid transport protein
MRNRDPGNDTDELGYRLKFNVKYIVSDQTSLRASISHDTEPSGDGDQVVRNRVSFGIDHDLTPLLTARFNADYVDNEDIFGNETHTSNEQQTTRYTSIRPALAYQLTEDWSVEAQYSFRYRLFEDENDHATSNSVFLTLQYNFPTWAGSED